MPKEKWEKIFYDKVVYDNDANDYYIEWVDLEKTDLCALMAEFFNVGLGHDALVQIKVKKGALFMVAVENESLRG